MAALNRLAIWMCFLGWVLIGCYRPILTAVQDRALQVYKVQTVLPAPAEEPTDLSLSLTLEDAIHRAVVRDYQVVQRRAAVALAEAEVDAADQLENPDLRINGLRLDEILDDETRLGVELRARPPRPGELAARVEEANAQVRRARARVSLEEWDVHVLVRALFEAVRFLDAEMEIGVLAIEARSTILDVARSRAEERMATAMEVALADLSLQEARQEIAALREERESAMRLLLDRVGLPPLAKVTLEGPSLDESLVQVLPTVESLIKQALSRRPELADAAARIEAAQAEVFLEKLDAWPWLSFMELGYEYGPGIDEMRAWTFGVALEIPIFSLNQGRIRAAKAREAWMERRFEAEVDEIAREVRQRYGDVRVAKAGVISMDAGSTKAVEAATEATRMAMNSGQIDVMTLAVVEDRRATILRQRVRALRRYAQALSRLLESTGGSWGEPSAPANSP